MQKNYIFYWTLSVRSNEISWIKGGVDLYSPRDCLSLASQQPSLRIPLTLSPSDRGWCHLVMVVVWRECESQAGRINGEVVSAGLDIAIGTVTGRQECETEFAP